LVLIETSPPSLVTSPSGEVSRIGYYFTSASVLAAPLAMAPASAPTWLYMLYQMTPMRGLMIDLGG
jgi:hypothetical protein